MKMQPLVDVDQEMSEEMLDALSAFEARCTGLGIKEVEPQHVKIYLKSNFSDELADQFRDVYLYPLITEQL